MSLNFNNVTFIYSYKTPFAKKALDCVDFSIKEGSFTAIVGRTGCGKSTLIQHLNALLIPTFGSLDVCDFKIENKKIKKINDLRKKVGLVFQFSEYQLFEETVIKDVMFGVRNFGATKEEAEKIAKEALSIVGLNETFYERSPFDLSGGEKRRVAIAGILAIKPSILVLDEPTAGLDPKGAVEIMNLFKKIHENGTTIIIVTHDMDIVLKYASDVVVMVDGKISKIGTPFEILNDASEKYSLETPKVYVFINELKKRGIDLSQDKIRDVDELHQAIIKRLKK